MKIILSNSSGVPIYQQIYEQVKNAIMQGELKEGESLPSIRSLAKELQISVITTKRTYEELERDGFIQTVPGKGSHVSTNNKELLREIRLRELEEKLNDVISESKLLGLEFEELQEMLKMLFYEEL